ncbi:MAG: VOC family protein [Ornithinimicrobium sp.]
MVIVMSGLQPYVMFPGTTRQALTWYAEIFGGEASFHTFEQFGREEGPPDAIAHGELSGPVVLGGADISGDEESVSMQGVRFALLGTTKSETMREWFATLSEGGTVTDELQKRPWGDWDGSVIDRFGVAWLIGFHE